MLHGDLNSPPSYETIPDDALQKWQWVSGVETSRLYAGRYAIAVRDLTKHKIEVGTCAFPSTTTPKMTTNHNEHLTHDKPYSTPSAELHKSEP